MQKISRALVSVYNKEGIVEFSRELAALGVEIISTGGTFTLLKSHNIPVKQVSEITGFPEILDGRVKTLHPVIHAGLLAVLDNPIHNKQLKDLHIAPIDLVVVNLYPFEETIAKENVSNAEAIEQIDIGGPAMLRSAAKNYLFTAVVTNPGQYKSLLAELKERSGSLSEDTCFSLAKEVFSYTSHYDAVISQYFHSNSPSNEPFVFPNLLTSSYRKVIDLRYGENPHQSAALYGPFEKSFKYLHGKELSYNNILDIDAAVQLVYEISSPACAIIKHTNPCGVGRAAQSAEAFQKAFATDPKSAFGGIIAFNCPIDVNTAAQLNELFSEVIIAPTIPDDVLEILTKKKDRRIIKFTPQLKSTHQYEIKTVTSGILVQTADTAYITTANQLHTVTKRTPTPDEIEALLFSWKVVKHVKSNAIVYALKDRTVGIGAGQMSRVDSSRLAVWKAKEAGLSLSKSVVASDAFFPFADGLLEAVSAGATAVIQPGGSKRDDEVIAAANDHDIAMVFTGIRHFKH